MPASQAGLTKTERFWDFILKIAIAALPVACVIGGVVISHEARIASCETHRKHMEWRLDQLQEQVLELQRKVK